MAKKTKKILFRQDPIPNILKKFDPESETYKQTVQSLQERLFPNMDDVITRYKFLPALLVSQGEYFELLKQARDLYLQGYFYSCVAMCGITAERILKDIFSKVLLVSSRGKVVPPNKDAIKNLESFPAKSICKFLINSGIIDKKLRPNFQKLAELRNKYAHAAGKNPEKDARSAVVHLHEIIKETVSIFKYFDIRKIKAVPK